VFELIKNVFGRKEREAIDRIRKYQTMYNDPVGKWVLEDILSMAKYGENALGGSDRETNFNLGQQNLGIEIAQLLTANISKLEEESKKQEEATDEQDL
jgi:hypothetical protein